jgi:hypothetical protein
VAGRLLRGRCEFSEWVEGGLLQIVVDGYHNALGRRINIFQMLK